MLLRLYQKRLKAAKKIKQNYSTIKAANGTPQHERYKKWDLGWRNETYLGDLEECFPSLERLMRPCKSNLVN
jgi:hypothetical protein